jgi:ribonuclease T1
MPLAHRPPKNAHRPPTRTSIRIRTFAAALALLFAASGGTVVAPEPATATVYAGCTMTRCADARTARTGWSSLNRPTARGWYTWPRNRGAARDAYRIVVNRSTRETRFTPDHYVDFYKL